MNDICRDMTERKRAEEKLRAVVDAAPNAMIITDGEGRIVQVNRQAEHLFGYPREELVGSPVEILVPGQFRARHSQLRGEFTAEPRIRPMGTGRNLFGLRKDGSEVPVEIGLNPIHTEEGMLIVASVVDITERKRAEAELRQLNDELEIRVELRTVELAAANRELEAFGYTVSHDLRAPLRHIVGFVEMLNDHAQSVLDEEGRQYLKTIADSAKRMGRLLDDLLTFSRLSRGSMTKSEISLLELVGEAREELAPQMQGRNIEWKIGPLPTVWGDRSLLRNVVVNLLSNALKYSRQRDPACIEVGCREQDRQEVCFVRDNGAGFDMRFVNKLFGVFQRLHPASQFEGTGIGLASVQRIIRRHGGRVWAEGEIDRGATFYFSIPKSK